MLLIPTVVLHLRVESRKEYRGQGIAYSLIEYAIKQQTCPIYTLPTPQALPLYQRLNFHSVPPSEIPNELLTSYRRFRQSKDGPTVMVIHP